MILLYMHDNFCGPYINYTITWTFFSWDNILFLIYYKASICYAIFLGIFFLSLIRNAFSFTRGDGGIFKDFYFFKIFLSSEIKQVLKQKTENDQQMAVMANGDYDILLVSTYICALLFRQSNNCFRLGGKQFF